MDNYKIGFVRSPSKAYREEQIALLKEYGCNQIVSYDYGEDEVKSEEALDELANILHENDELVVMGIERLIYSLLDLAIFIEKVKQKKVKIIIIQKNDHGISATRLNTADLEDRAILQMFAMAIENERKIIRPNLIKDGIIKQEK